MKNNIFIITVFLIFSIGIIYSTTKKDVDHFIVETKKDVETIEKDRKKVFEMADQTIEMMDYQKKEMQFKLDSLDVELYEKQKVLNSYINSFEENKRLNFELEKKNKKLLEQYKSIRENLNHIVTINQETNQKLEKTYNEKELLKDQYSELSKLQNENKFYYVDTVYMVDTLIYKKEEIKKLKLKDKN
jgi:hypothetical protein